MLHNEARELLVKAYQKNPNARMIAEMFSVSASTVYRLVEHRDESKVPPLFDEICHVSVSAAFSARSEYGRGDTGERLLAVQIAVAAFHGDDLAVFGIRDGIERRKTELWLVSARADVTPSAGIERVAGPRSGHYAGRRLSVRRKPLGERPEHLAALPVERRAV